MIRGLLAGLMVSLCLGCSPQTGVAGPDPVVLARIDPNADAPAPGLRAAYGLGAPHQGLTLSGLAALGEVELRADFPVGGEVQVWRGVRLTAVLRALGAPEGADVRLTALDGYQVDVPGAMILAHEPVLAYARDGLALDVGGLGPLILVWPRADDPELQDMTDDLWPWGVFAVTVLSED